MATQSYRFPFDHIYYFQNGKRSLYLFRNGNICLVNYYRSFVIFLVFLIFKVIPVKHRNKVILSLLGFGVFTASISLGWKQGYKAGVNLPLYERYKENCKRSQPYDASPELLRALNLVIQKYDNSNALQIYHDYIDRTMALWTGNMRKAGEEKTVYDHRRLTEKTLRKIGKSLESGKVGFAWDKPMVINGRGYPSLKDTFSLAVSLVGEPEEIVLDTGDANGSNILIAQDGRWVLIDFEKAGWYDPAYIVARQLGQWALTVNNPNDVTHSYSIYDGRNVVDYMADVPSLVAQMEEEAMELGHHLSSVGDTSWRQRAAYYQLVFLSRMAVLSSSRFYGLLRQNDLSKVVLAKAVEGFYQLIDQEWKD